MMKRHTWAAGACCLLMGLGLLTSAYLFQRTLRAGSDQSAAGIDICSIVFQTGCDEALLSSYGDLLGVPLAGWGVVYFGAIAFLFVFGQLFKKGFQRESLVALLCIDIVAVAIGVVLSMQFFTGRIPYCPLCIVIHLLNVVLFPALFVLNGQGPRALMATLGAGARWPFGGKSGDAVQSDWKAVGFLAAGLFAVVLFQWTLLRTERVTHVADAGTPEDQVFAEFRSVALQVIPIDESDPRKGTESARVQIVVFSSFQCPGCRKLAPELTSLQGRFQGDVAVVFKHFPLGTDCNPILRRDMHPRACAIADAAVAADLQGQFWAFHDAVFAVGLHPSEEEIVRVAEELKLDLARFSADRRSDEVTLKIQRDVELGAQLGVSETPAIFINGRRVPSEGLEMLSSLVEEVLEGL